MQNHYAVIIGLYVLEDHDEIATMVTPVCCVHMIHIFFIQVKYI